MIIVILGVAGSGKTTVGQLLARSLDWPFYEGDEYHPAANIKKMAAHHPLNDADREPWLTKLAQVIRDLDLAGRSAVVACSALKQQYRDLLSGSSADVKFVYLKAEYDLIRRRLLQREAHFMKADLLQSQFDILEVPAHAIVVDAARDPASIVRQIRTRLGL